MVPFIRCRNQVTGAVAEVPETALPHLSDWIPIESEPDTEGGADAVPGDQANTPPADDNATATEPETATTRRTTRSKPADPATDKKEL